MALPNEDSASLPFSLTTSLTFMPEPEVSASTIPYQAYRSKRHSRNLSSTSRTAANGTSPAPTSRPNSVVVTDYAEKLPSETFTFPAAPVVVLEPPPPAISPPPELLNSGDDSGLSSADGSRPQTPQTPQSPKANGYTLVPLINSEPSTSTASPPPASRKASTFRHVRRPARPSPLNPAQSHTRASSATTVPSILESTAATKQLEAVPLHRSTSGAATPPLSQQKSPLRASVIELPFAPSPPPLSKSPEPPLSAPPMQQSTSTSTIASLRHRTTAKAPYRPGFQPKGVYRPRTDEFIAARRIARDGTPGAGSQKRIERAKLERRLEKLIKLHFSPTARPEMRQRTSSLFSITSLGDLRGVLTPGKTDRDLLRAEEQRITPWQDDAEVTSCPSCTSSFHPLTNRKHHCRLCGKVICSLPVKRPKRPTLCSTLFVVDSNTRKIEEVGEGVDYGVKRRRTSSISGPAALQQQEDEAEKFLKGVRICRDCRPVLLKQQYSQEMTAVPTFAKFYDAFLSLEKEIEASLPQFQELVLDLSNEEAPTKEAAAIRKRLLDNFHQYEMISKRIGQLPTPPGSSQDRVQRAVMTRANLFLQNNMFPLKSLPKPKPKPRTQPENAEPANPGYVDPSSEVAIVLQPLLEQEALLESFVEEAQARRKFEDAKTLRDNLKEIRGEIERTLRSSNEADVFSR